jgi:hypothetical protein
MIRRSFRVGLRLGILVGAVLALVKSLQGRRDAKELAAPPPGRWYPDPPPVAEAAVLTADEAEAGAPVLDDGAAAPASRSGAEEPWTDDVLPPAADSPAMAPAKRTAKAPAQAPVKRPARIWVEPTGAVCPRTHPVKAKMTSGLFHLPGMLNYARTRPDRCYASEEAAVADGLTKSKR